MAVPLDLVALTVLPVWQWRSVAAQLRSGQPASDILDARCAGGRKRHPPPQWSDPRWARQRAQKALDSAAAAQLAVLSQTDPAYPAALRELIDAPPVLWVAGHTGALARVSVAIVGARAASAYALNVAGQLGADLAARGVAVVSGLARGVDSAAHRGALAAGGVTIAVLGNGADIVYPPEHAELAGAIVQHGAMVSELLPGTLPKPMFFPRRNRIISGLVRAVVVIEAGERSGSLITARCALEQGREVLAVPGNVLSGRNRGGHALLRDGARLVETAEDILDELGLERGGGASQSAGVPDVVLAAMTNGEVTDIGEIAARSGLSVPALLPRLLTLELRGLVKREAGGRFVRFDRNVLG